MQTVRQVADADPEQDVETRLAIVKSSVLGSRVLEERNRHELPCALRWKREAKLVNSERSAHTVRVELMRSDSDTTVLWSQSIKTPLTSLEAAFTMRML